jgi:hypothetical protein
MRVGKAREKKWRDWSGECESRKDSIEAQVEEIWDGEVAARMASARSLDLDWESKVYEWGSIVRAGGGVSSEELKLTSKLGLLEFRERERGFCF